MRRIVRRGTAIVTSMTAKNGTATSANCLQATAARQAGRSPEEPAADEESEGEDEREQRRRVGGAEPRAADGERVRGQHRADRQLPEEWRREEQGGEEEAERRQHDEDPVVVDRARAAAATPQR